MFLFISNAVEMRIEFEIPVDMNTQVSEPVII